MRERTIVSHTPLGFLELPLLACAVGFHRVSFSARSRLRIAWMLFLMLSIYGLKQQYMVKTGSMLGSMKLDKLRAFAAGLGVQQRDPASGSRLSKSQLLEAVVAALRSRAQLQVDPTSLVFLLSSFGTCSRQALRYRSVSFSARSGQRRACSKECFCQQCFPECKRLVALLFCACSRTM